ncbi:MAG: B12-binding domain-containing radical SAM protein [Thermocladium sp.]
MRIAVAYPSSPSIAQLSTSYKYIKATLENEGFLVDGVSMNGIPPRGEKTNIPLNSFDYIIFTIHYELDYINMVKMLAYSKIPVSSSKRGGFPTVIIGGPPVLANPEPIASFVDVVALGDLEELMPRLINGLTGKLEGFEELGGFYVPSLGKHEVRKVYIDHIEHSPLSIIKVDGSLFGSDALVEVMRGCPHHCLFCMESYINMPVRLGNLSSLSNRIKESGLKRIALVGLSVGDHPGIRQFINGLVETGISLSFPSLRVDTLDCDLIRSIIRSGQRTLTIAPESSFRLRRILGKDFSSEELIEKARCAFDNGINRIKMYYMVGLPGEQYEDLRQIKLELIDVSRLGSTYVSVNPWIPKPHTPLQWFSMIGINELKKRIRLVTQDVREYSFYDPIHATVQALLSLGDRDVAAFILDAARISKDHLDKGDYRRLLASHPDLLDKYVYAHRRPGDVLPWSHIKINNEKMLESLYWSFINELEPTVGGSNASASMAGS